MSNDGYVIGIDYGTESARGVLLDVDSGELVACYRHNYRHGVMERSLPCGRRLPPDWALQDADDYIEATVHILGELARHIESGAALHSIGIDFTASTPLPVLADGTPLSRRHPDEPHAYVKLWKHHSAQPWAEKVNATHADFLDFTGGQTSCEWVVPKAAQMIEEAPRLWDETKRFMEAGDWMVWQLTGREVRSACQAGYKAHYLSQDGYPAQIDELAPGLLDRLGEPRPVGQAAGPLGTDWLRRTGLPGEPIVAVAVIDAHAVVPAVGVAEPGILVGSLGTSACQLLLDNGCYKIPGVAGAVKDGIVPGFWGYECGQAGFGDILGWFVRTFPWGESEDVSFSRYNEAAAAITPGQTGIIALDWWNGCRTPLMDPDLSGVFVGMTLQTRHDELYRALLECLCFGMRRIISTLEDGGLAIRRLVLTSGLAERNPLLMQIMADVTGREVHVPSVTEATARGAAIYGAVAAGVVNNFHEGIQRLGAAEGQRYQPSSEASAIYHELYGVYCQLADWFAQGTVMKILRRTRNRSLKLATRDGRPSRSEPLLRGVRAAAVDHRGH